MSGDADFDEITYKGHDGLTLYARDYGGGERGHFPVVCLPGLTRNTKDFHDLASFLSPKRRVVTLEFRGRGKSGYAEDAATYTPAHELADTLHLLDRLGLDRIIAIGTSRGGIVTMLMAQQNPERLAGAVLNDVGPVIEMEGIKRIAGYAGTMEVPPTWEELAQALKSANTPAFDMPDEKWMAFARNTFAEENGKPKMDYDPRIGDAIRAAAEAEGEMPDMWEMFSALKAVPVLVIRGANSDLLSKDTVKRMRTAHTSLDAVTIEGRGHAPLLDEPEAVAAIEEFLDRVDRDG